MLKKISLLVFLSAPLMILADGHDIKGDDLHENVNEMEVKERKRAHMREEMEKRGMWKLEDCKKISDASGIFLYLAGEAMKEGEKHEEMGHEGKADKHYLDAMALADLAANYAKNFEAYCKR